MARRFNIQRADGAESGPFAEEQLKAMLDSGELSPWTLIRSERWKQRWIPADIGWFPLGVLFGGIHFGDVRIPRSTVIRWSLIAAGFVALVILRMLME